MTGIFLGNLPDYSYQITYYGISIPLGIEMKIMRNNAIKYVKKHLLKQNEVH